MMGLFWLAVIVLVVLAVRWIAVDASGGNRALGDTSRNDALAILDERFARGEIDTTEYEERRRALRAKR
jgi:putative membrane protein